MGRGSGRCNRFRRELSWFELVGEIARSSDVCGAMGVHWVPFGLEGVFRSWSFLHEVVQAG